MRAGEPVGGGRLAGRSCRGVELARALGARGVEVARGGRQAAVEGGASPRLERAGARHGDRGRERLAAAGVDRAQAGDGGDPRRGGGGVEDGHRAVGLREAVAPGVAPGGEPHHVGPLGGALERLQEGGREQRGRGCGQPLDRGAQVLTGVAHAERAVEAGDGCGVAARPATGDLQAQAVVGDRLRRRRGPQSARVAAAVGSAEQAGDRSGDRCGDDKRETVATGSAALRELAGPCVCARDAYGSP